MELVAGRGLWPRGTQKNASAGRRAAHRRQGRMALTAAPRGRRAPRPLPGNVMLGKSGAKPMDFGLARDRDAMAGRSRRRRHDDHALTRSPTVAPPDGLKGSIVGTFQYMSPEQMEGREADSRRHLGARLRCCNEMTTGKRAYEGRDAGRASSAPSHADTPRPLTEVAPMSPPALERLILQCLAKDPDERWQSAGDVRRELSIRFRAAAACRAHARLRRRSAVTRGRNRAAVGRGSRCRRSSPPRLARSAVGRLARPQPARALHRQRNRPEGTVPAAGRRGVVAGRLVLLLRGGGQRRHAAALRCARSTIAGAAGARTERLAGVLVAGRTQHRFLRVRQAAARCRWTAARPRSCAMRRTHAAARGRSRA